MTHASAPGTVCNCTTSSSDLALPATLTDDLEGAHLKKVNMILLEYARDITLLQSRAYDAVLKVISAPCAD